ncbi:hypothetical protein R69658_00113 [Paraburkholderia aspalathi]|uniref:Cell wall surface anchor family protein n=1 Tax=Paraburkholderia aspalathi TaxID=1324617 RepID=A0ABM8QED6_9BURK|nr:hypothetical protein [Paraburkholderia aspalathi]MBK3816834.1 hypothetical protein [Paraburkholderia aspalathi]MBK3828616.1 hypothetical protein [Paraburkholderia aspalathi]MBK3858370.1 hypothetical protein [Paraburkholderia aspalathi]CAE6692639.1 hypothetical protein R69658_00113 [Paraburkholderia aspalathi]CAE6695807.1 hypothetical protein R20943_00290 [Paraburkholderia aspalathi]
MADSAASTQSRPQRAASKKRRQATVSTETENKLARAARSAQRLAQLSDASRDDSTLDLFPDDPTRATLEAMNIDVRQGTLHGFELPDVVLAAVGVIDADGMSPEARAARRAPRAAKSDEPVPVNAQLSGLETEAVEATASPVGELAFGDVKAAAEASAEEKSAASARDAAAPLTSAMAAATVARSVTALRQAAEPGAVTTDAAVASTSGGAKPAAPPQRFAATFAKAATASREEVGVEGANARAERASSSSSSESGAMADAGAVIAEPKPAAKLSGNVSASAWSASASTPASASASSAHANASFSAPSFREAQRAEAAAAALRAAPELDRARATAFADTVDALYGVIADQRLAATDHSRRMKWMLSIVVGALLMTVAIGITQTVLLMRLTRETTAQQHRIEQMMQNQQAAMASLLDTHIAMANAAAANAASDAAATAAPQAAAATPAHSKRGTRAQHAHKPKAANSH